MSETENPMPRQHAYGFGIVVNLPLIEGYAMVAQEDRWLLHMRASTRASSCIRRQC
jgi:hypothetical protein